jgi:hypothetical protein
LSVQRFLTWLAESDETPTWFWPLASLWILATGIASGLGASDGVAFASLAVLIVLSVIFFAVPQANWDARHRHSR